MTRKEAWELILDAAQEAAEILANDLDSESSVRANAIYSAVEILAQTEQAAIVNLLEQQDRLERETW